MAHLRNAHFELDTDESLHVVRLVRTPEPFHSVRDMVAVLEEIFLAIEGVDGATYGLVVDNRKGPVRTDPAFQAAFASFRTRLDARFARVGVVFASEESIQQLDDVGPSPNVRAYTDEGAATRWASEGHE